MAQETETKILNINLAELISKLTALGANKTQDTRLFVDWYRIKGIGEGEDPWFLRIRTYSNGKSEVTWKANSKITGVARTHREINMFVTEPDKMAELFIAIDLEHYAHQEKDRVSFELNGVKFDIDTYPDMPPYLEIEADSEQTIQKNIQLLELEKYRASSEGERVLIQNEYKLDWYWMYFNKTKK